VDDSSILKHVDELVAEEHELRSGSALSDEQRARLSHLEQDLDQCWDLLRQRRARREFNENPDEAEVRAHSQVESYRQ
jgi:hypothetical protein